MEGIINEAGEEVRVLLVGLRYYEPFTEEAESIEDAKRAAENHVEHCTAAPGAVIVGGDVVLVETDHPGSAYCGWRPPTDADLAALRRSGEWPQG